MTHEVLACVRRGRRGFTLIEVLIAAFIIALGVLGLLALFAGAARQQQAATQTTLSVMAAKNAEAVLSGNFGALRNPPPPCTDPFEENVWYALPMDAQHRFLTVNPGNSSCGPYFLVAPTTPMPYALYEDTGLVLGADPGFSMGMPDGPYTSIRDFGQRRIDPESLSLVVTIVDQDGNPVPGGQTTYSRVANPPTPYPFDATSAGLYTYTPGGSPYYAINGTPYEVPAQPQPLDYIVVDVQNAPAGNRPASVYEMNIAAVELDPTVRVQRLEAADYRWRNDQLVSLSDRLYVRSDASAPGGQRPFMSYSVLYRRTATASQMAVFTYELVAPSTSATYIPKETAANFTAGAAPLRELTKVELRFDTVSNRYYIQVQGADEWIVEPGQILLVKGFDPPTQSPAPVEELGSDLPVQVVQKARPQGSTSGWIGYLDRSPRAGGASMLDPQKRISGGKVDLTMIAVNDVVTSDADGTRWRLRPLEARLFQVLNSN